MASFQCLTTFTTTPPPHSTFNRRFKTHPKQITQRFKVSCNLTPHDNEKPFENQNLILPKTSLDTTNVDRRNLLLGLGGLYTTANFTSFPAALASPITTPDISTCITANQGMDTNNIIRTQACCPPSMSKTIKDFELPKHEKTKIRPVAHKASHDYVKKYQRAIQAMRDLPEGHPHSFIEQAKIHCAYCNGGYTQIASGFPDKMLQIHNSWLFFPFHRWYLFFYERILGKLIDDPSFALPYWNWDHPNGMELPHFFEGGRGTNPAFDIYRNSDHLPPAIIDLDYSDSDNGFSNNKQIRTNLTLMYKQMIRNAGDPLSFFGGKYKAGDDPVRNGDPSVGSVEAGCHTAVHRWVGDPLSVNHEDMGNFYSAGYDPAFYVHHANVDRMWEIWRDMRIRGHSEPKDPDWLDASYVFYDENEELVRVYNRDCVRMKKLNYDYEYSPHPWRNSRPTPRNKNSDIAKKSTRSVKEAEDIVFPLKIDKMKKILVKRPGVNRSEKDKEIANEVLLISDIKFNCNKYVKFDVFVNYEGDVNEDFEEDSEFAGSFAELPHNEGDDMVMKSAIRFGLTELLEDIEAEDDEVILVTIVPDVGCEDVTIGNVSVELVPLS